MTQSNTPLPPLPPPPANPHPRRNSGIQIPEAYREFIISLRVWHPSSPDYMLNPDHPDTTGIYNPHIRNTSIRNRRFRTMRIETVSKSNNSNNNNNQKRIIQLKLWSIQIQHQSGIHPCGCVQVAADKHSISSSIQTNLNSIKVHSNSLPGNERGVGRRRGGEGRPGWMQTSERAEYILAPSLPIRIPSKGHPPIPQHRPSLTSANNQIRVDLN